MTGESDREAPVFEFRPRRGRRRAGDEDPVALSDLMVPALARLGLKTKARQVQLMLAWPKVAGEGVAAESRVVDYARGRVTVETSSPAMSHGLLLQKQLLIDGLNAALRDDAVREIRFRLAASASPK